MNCFEISFQFGPETQGLNGDGKGRQRLGAGKKEGVGGGGGGGGGEGKAEMRSSGKLLHTDHF